MNTKLSLKQHLFFFKQLNAYIKSGIAPINYLSVLRKQCSSKRVQTVLVRMERAVRQGKSLSDGLKMSGQAIDEAHQAMFALGEETGKLELVTSLLADYFEKKLSLRRKLLSGLIYPIFLLLAAVFLPPLYILITKGVGPYVLTIIKPLSIIITPIIIIYTIKILDLKKIRILFDKIQLVIPVWNSFIWKSDAASLCRMSAIGIEAGGELHFVLKNAIKSVSNSGIQQRLMTLSDQNNITPDTLGSILTFFKHHSGIYNMLKTGIETGDLPEMMNKAADYLEEEVNAQLNSIVVIVPVILYLLVAIYIGYIVITFWSNLYNSILQP